MTLFETNILPKKSHATNCYTMRLSKNKNFSIEKKYLTDDKNFKIDFKALCCVFLKVVAFEKCYRKCGCITSRCAVNGLMKCTVCNDILKSVCGKKG